MDIRIVSGGLKDMALVKPLWERLNAVHLEKSVHFKKKYKHFTFEQRMEPVLEKAGRGQLKIDLLMDGERAAGYCISSIENGSGEIESIYIEPELRGGGWGGKLIERALSWFEENGIEDISIGVVYDNKDALPFYERYGFQISTYVLKRPKR